MLDSCPGSLCRMLSRYLVLERTFEKCRVDVALLIGARGCQREAGILVEQEGGS